MHDTGRGFLLSPQGLLRDTRPSCGVEPKTELTLLRLPLHPPAFSFSYMLLRGCKRLLKSRRKRCVGPLFWNSGVCVCVFCPVGGGPQGDPDNVLQDRFSLPSVGDYPLREEFNSYSFYFSVVDACISYSMANAVRSLFYVDIFKWQCDLSSIYGASCTV